MVPSPLSSVPFRWATRYSTSRAHQVEGSIDRSPLRAGVSPTNGRLEAPPFMRAMPQLPPAIVTRRCLERYKREDPVLRRPVLGDGLLQVVVAGRNEQVQGVGGLHRRPLEITRVRGLEKGGLAPFLDEQPPWESRQGGPASTSEGPLPSPPRPGAAGPGLRSTPKGHPIERETCARRDVGEDATPGTLRPRVSPSPRTAPGG